MSRFSEDNPAHVQVLLDIIGEKLDMYDVINAPKGEDQIAVGAYLQEKYGDVSIDHGLHADDGHEEIYNIMLDQIEEDFGE